METVEQLIKERTFDSLTGEELASVKELCGTEEEFLTMQRFFRELDTVTASGKTIINPEIKSSLDGIFSAKHPGIRANWTAPETVAAPVAPVIPLHQRTWVRIAAVAVLILGTAPFWNMLRTEVPAKTAQTAQLSERKTSEKNNIGAAMTDPEVEAVPTPERSAQFKAEMPADADPENTVTWAATSAEDAASAPTHEWNASPSAAYKRYDKDEVADGMFAVSTKESEKKAAPAGALGMVAAEPDLRAGFGYFANAGNANADNKKTDTQVFYSFSQTGTQADLHPNASLLGADITVTAYSVAEQPDDLLDLLVPAF